MAPVFNPEDLKVSDPQKRANDLTSLGSLGCVCHQQQFSDSVWALLVGEGEVERGSEPSNLTLSTAALNYFLLNHEYPFSMRFCWGKQGEG